MQKVSNRTMVSIANATIKPASGKDLTKYRNGDTGDIIKETLECYRDCVNDVEGFAPNLKAKDLLTTCRNVWQFVKQNIKYKIDPEGVQWVRTPARLWKDKEGDCKSMAVTTACILHQLGVNGVFRFVSFNALTPTPTHVYVVVPTADGEIKIDPVLNSFNEEKPYFFKQDYNMTQISRLSGIGATTQQTGALQRLIFERSVEKANGTLTADRAKKYEYLIQSLRNGGSIGDLTSIITNAASGNYFGAAASALQSIFKSGGPNPNDWKGWSPTGADARYWVKNNGDSVSNEAVNILSWINANGIQKMFNSDTGVDAVTIQDIANKVQAGGFPAQAQQILRGEIPSSTTQGNSNSSGSFNNPFNSGSGANNSGYIPPADNTKQSGVNTWLMVGLGAAALYAITRK